MTSSRYALACLPLIISSACSSSSPSNGPSLAIAVAPLTLSGLADACYTLTVYDGARASVGNGAQTVWTESAVCASRYGAGSSIAYVGTCDAGDTGSKTNTVALVLDRVCTGAACGAPGSSDVVAPELVNPCPADAPCFAEAECRNNSDTPVEFDLTAMRSAQQGFFDVAVELDDVFCSAKLDCEDDAGAPLSLVFDPATQERTDTIVFGFACTAGSGADTYLHWQDVSLACTSAGGQSYSYTFDPSGRGNLRPTFGTNPRVVVDAASYVSGELLADASGPTRAGFWNVAVGIDPDVVSALGLTCSVALRGTVTDGPLASHTIDATRVYPVVAWDATLFEDGVRTCDQSPINDADGNVHVAFERPGDTRTVFPRCYSIVGDTFCTDGGPTDPEDPEDPEDPTDPTDPQPLAGPGLAFVATDAVAGKELFVTDCTQANTRLVDVNPTVATGFDAAACQLEYDESECANFANYCAMGWSFALPEGMSCGVDSNSEPQGIYTFAGVPYFSAEDATGTRNLYRLTSTGAQKVESAGAPVTLDSIGEGETYPGLVAFAGTLYVVASDADHGSELFRINDDGKLELAADFEVGPDASFPLLLKVAGNRLYAGTLSGGNGNRGLFWIDAAGNSGNIPVPNGFRAVINFAALGDTFYFEAFAPQFGQGTGAFIVAPGATSATTVSGFLPSTDNSQPVVGGGKVFTQAITGSQRGPATVDAGGNGTYLGTVGFPLAQSTAYSVAHASYYFSLNTGGLYRTDGVQAPSLVSASGTYPVDFGNGLLYLAPHNNPTRLERYDGAAVSTLVDFAPRATNARTIIPFDATRVVVFTDAGPTCVDTTGATAPVVLTNPTGQAWSFSAGMPKRNTQQVSF